MWPRISELLIGIWLVAAPAVLAYPGPASVANSVLSGAAVTALSLLAWLGGFGHARFGTLLISVWLGAFAYFASSHPAPPFRQSEFLAGILLAMMAIIPNRCNRPPVPWERVSPPESESESV